MRKYLFVLLVLFSFCVSAEVLEKGLEVGGSDYLRATSLGGNLKVLEDYYAEINKQLDSQMHRNPRDPFEKVVRSEGVQPDKPRFIPRANVKESSVTEPTVGQPIMSKAKVDLGAFPAMQFKGFLKSDGEKAGLLDIAGQGTFVVHEGDQVGLRQNNGEMVIRVVEINALNLIVEFGSLGEKVVVQ